MIVPATRVNLLSKFLANVNGSGEYVSIGVTLSDLKKRRISDTCNAHKFPIFGPKLRPKFVANVWKGLTCLLSHVVVHHPVKAAWLFRISILTNH